MPASRHCPQHDHRPHCCHLRGNISVVLNTLSTTVTYCRPGHRHIYHDRHRVAFAIAMVINYYPPITIVQSSEHYFNSVVHTIIHQPCAQGQGASLMRESPPCGRTSCCAPSLPAGSARALTRPISMPPHAIGRCRRRSEARAVALAGLGVHLDRRTHRIRGRRWQR